MNKKTSQNAMVSVLLQENSLQSYLEQIKKIPMLKPEEEFRLAKLWTEEQDTAAAHTLVTSHLRLVAKISMSYRGYGLPVADLISEGNIGLMTAVKKFQPDRGFRLATYAMWWIRASIHEYILHSWSLVKIGTTAAQKKLFFNLKRAKQRINHLDNATLTPDEVAAIALDLGVSNQEVINMDQRMRVGDQSLNAPMLGKDGEESTEIQDFLVDEAQNPYQQIADKQEHDVKRSLIDNALAKLNERERTIVLKRHLSDDPMTLEDLSHEMSVSRERIRQIETRAMEKLTQYLKKDQHVLMA